MTQEDTKPLNWIPAPDVGYTVHRRPDGGMHYIFTDLTPATLAHWREFSLAHLIESDRLTRNLYDLRLVAAIPPEALNIALELGGDPGARNIRMAVVVASEAVRHAIEEISALLDPGGVDIAIFTDIQEAETWLERPLTLTI